MNIDSFEQYTQGDYVYQAGPNSPIQRKHNQEEMLACRAKALAESPLWLRSTMPVVLVRLIASAADISEPSQHAHFDQAKFEAELKGLNLGLIGSEFSQTEPRYITGAIDHVNHQASTIL